MVDVILIAFGVLLILAGAVGSFLPVIPGPTLAYLGLLLSQLTEIPPFSTNFMILWAIIVLATIAMDYLITPLATKKFGGSQKGVVGSMVGLILGIFLFPPIGFLIGPLIGAYVGELIDGKDTRTSMKAAFGALVGFITGSLMKFAVVIIMGYYFVQSNF